MSDVFKCRSCGVWNPGGLYCSEACKEAAEVRAALVPKYSWGVQVECTDRAKWVRVMQVEAYTAEGARRLAALSASAKWTVPLDRLAANHVKLLRRGPTSKSTWANKWQAYYGPIDWRAQ